MKQHTLTGDGRLEPTAYEQGRMDERKEALPGLIVDINPRAFEVTLRFAGEDEWAQFLKAELIRKEWWPEGKQ